MYTISVERKFTAKHYLIGGDFGAENEVHPHNYKVQVRVSGSFLDDHGFLVDINEINAQLDSALDYFKDQTLNDLPQFADLNPSVEHFARIFCRYFSNLIEADKLNSLTVRMWEYEDVWAEFTEQWR